MIKMGFFVGFIIFLVAGFIFFARWQTFHISKVSVLGALNEAHAQSLIQSVEEILNEHYAFFIPKRNTLWYPKKVIEKRILTKNPQIKEVTVKRNARKELVLSVILREPFALWCDFENMSEHSQDTIESNVSVTTKEECFYIDMNGVVYAPAPEFDEQVYVRYGGLLSSEHILGVTFIEEKELQALSAFLEFLKQKGYSATRVFIHRDTGDMHITLSKGTELRMKRGEDSLAILEVLETVLSSEAFENIRVEDIEYIDFRFGNRVYYKKKTNDKEGAYFEKKNER